MGLKVIDTVRKNEFLIIIEGNWERLGCSWEKQGVHKITNDGRKRLIESCGGQGREQGQTKLN